MNKKSEKKPRNKSPFNYSLKLLGKRKYSVYQLQNKLQQKGFEYKEVIRKLKKEGLLDDLDFAESFIRTKDLLSPRGSIALKWELKKRGIDEETIAKALEKVERDEGHLAQKLAFSRLKSMGPSVPKEVKLRRIISLLQRRGFSSGIIYKIIRQINP